MATKSGSGASKSGGPSGGASKSSGSKSGSSGGAYKSANNNSNNGPSVNFTPSYSGGGTSIDWSEMPWWGWLILLGLVVALVLGVLYLGSLNHAPISSASEVQQMEVVPIDTSNVSTTSEGYWGDLPDDITANSLPDSYTEVDTNCYEGCTVYFNLPGHGDVALFGNWNQVDTDRYQFYPDYIWIEGTSGSTGVLGDSTYTTDVEGEWITVPDWLTADMVPQEYTEEDPNCFTECTIYVYIEEMGGDVTLNGDWIETGNDQYTFTPYYYWGTK